MSARPLLGSETFKPLEAPGDSEDEIDPTELESSIIVKSAPESPVPPKRARLKATLYSYYHDFMYRPDISTHVDLNFDSDESQVYQQFVASLTPFKLKQLGNVKLVVTT
jgi:hypothetical protein